jgi:flagellar basal-body rod modification protein FlgD
MTTTTPATSTPAATNANGTQSSGNALGQLSSNFSTFLTLLTTQLKNQDPTSPMDSNQFTQQLVEFSQVEQQINTNTNLNTLITQGQSQIGSYATSYLGKSVSITNGNASLANGQATWVYGLGTAASQTTLTVSDANGKVVYTGPGSTAAGNNQFNWNGKDNNGNQLADGTYTLAVGATAADGSAVTTNVASAGVVSEIDMTSGTPKLVIGNMEIGLGDIANVANTASSTN